MIITVKNADYSGAGLGFTNWVKEYISKAGITDETQKTALLAMDAAIESAGLWPSIFGIVPFCGSTAAQQKWVFKKGEFNSGVFTGSGNTAGGYVAGEGNVFKFPYIYPDSSPSNFSMGVYNKTAETNPTVGTHRAMMGLNNVNNGYSPSHKVVLSRRYSTGGGNYTTFSQLGSTSNGGFCFLTSGTYDNTKVGLLQVVKDGSALSMIDNGVVIKTATSAEVLNSGGGNGITIGGVQLGGTVVADYSAATITFAYWGKLTAVQAVAFNTIVNTFLTTIGRN
jgi:hypothetical protein